MTKVHKNKGHKNQRMQEINDEVQKLEGQTEAAIDAIFNHYMNFREEIEDFLTDRCDSREKCLDRIFKLHETVEKNLENRQSDILILEKCIGQVDSLFDSFRQTRVMNHFLILF